MDTQRRQQALTWQIGVWDGMAERYVREIDRRFAPVVAQVVARAAPQVGASILDLGTGTGAVAARLVPLIGPTGQILAVDISPAMLAIARQRFAAQGLAQVGLCAGQAEAIPAADDSFDLVVASLSLMYVIDRAAAAREIGRVLKAGGRFVAAVWAGPVECDIVLFQETAGRFAGPPPVPGVGPGALADPAPLLAQLAAAGIAAHVEQETLGFDFDDFTSAWEVLAGVTTAHLAPEDQAAAKAAVFQTMYPQGDGPRHFRNVTHFIVGSRCGE